MEGGCHRSSIKAAGINIVKRRLETRHKSYKETQQLVVTQYKDKQQ